MANFSICSTIIGVFSVVLLVKASEHTWLSENETSFESSNVKNSKIAPPIVLDNATEVVKDAKSLSCSFFAEEASELMVKWFKNGLEWNGSKAINNKMSTTTITGIVSTPDVTEYTCQLYNIDDPTNVSSKTFLVSTTNYMMYIYVLAAIIAGSLIALLIETTKRLLNVINALRQIRLLKRDDPVDSSSIIIDKNRNNWRFLGEGAYGEVWSSIIQYGNQLKIVVLKTFKYLPFLDPKAAELLFGDLKTEIQINQKLSHPRNQGAGSEYIVRYAGFYAQSLMHLKVYLILEHCEPGQLEKFLHQCVKDAIFFNDIDIENEAYLYNERLEEERATGGEILGMSHLMKWSEQIALAMMFIHSHNIVHRDLAARNILLMGPPHYETLDDVIVQLADFGMSRDLGDSQAYFIVDGITPKPRQFPKLWYPPESIPDDIREWNVGYDKKSDVWSFGVLLWEMFSLGGCTSDGLGPNIQTDDCKQLKKALLAGERLKRDYLFRMPDEIWLLMERCWNVNPAARPNFREIHHELNRINTLFGLHHENSANQAGDLNDNNDDSENDDNDDVLPPESSNLHSKLVQQTEQNSTSASATSTHPSPEPGTSSMSHLTHKHNLELEDRNVDSQNKLSLPDKPLFLPERVNLFQNVGVVSFNPKYVHHEHADES